MKQSDRFLHGEGDAYFSRNRNHRLSDADPILGVMAEMQLPSSASILEIGCSDGQRLQRLAAHHSQVAGIEPSAAAVASARSRGLSVTQGTASKLEAASAQYDVVIFGFCLYLCDRVDLPSIVSEADRVIKSPGWVIIHDFYSPTPVERPYHHAADVLTFKRDYAALFTDLPSYVLMTQRVRHHSTFAYTDDPQEWVATSVLRKLA